MFLDSCRSSLLGFTCNLLRDRAGARYLIGTQLVTVIASAVSSGDLFELVSITGCLSDTFPVHRHASAHDDIYV